jgi:hypothetical protein
MLDEQSGTLTSGNIDGTYNNTIMAQPDGIRNGKPIHLQYHGDSGGASRFFYCAKASRGERGHGNTHPTVKPLKLLEWLCRLTATPTGGVVLDPFLGSGTTALACLNTGRRCIGIEKDAGYCRIAIRRLKQARK